MIYLSSIIVLLVAYVGFLHFKLHKLSKNLKEDIKEDEAKKIDEKSDIDELYVQIDSDFVISNIRESSCKALGYEKDDIIGKSVLGTIVENSPANLQLLKTHLQRLSKKATAIKSEILITNSNGEKKLILCRFRPVLNEVLKCIGISMLGKNISEKINIDEINYNLKNIDPLTNTLNEKAFIEKLEHEFALSKRYNREFSLISVELNDVYEFIAHGVNYEKADKLLTNVAKHCQETAGQDSFVGRFDKTKIGLIMPNKNRESALEFSKKIFDDSIEIAKELGIDKYNGGMIVISYTNKKSYNETYDLLLQRLKKHTQTAARKRVYGIISSEYGSK